MRCTACHAELLEHGRFCSSCGTPAPATEQDRTRSTAPSEQPTGTAESPYATSPPGRSGAAGKERFAPGTMIGTRYRVVGLIGRGGMGEVYRADDLKLGRPVALKFLPETLEREPARLERFLNEVRVALRVSHPNVCRVHDVGEVGERHFISMEYVDGEDLASLLRRIGRFPQERALRVTRQLCAGLAAAHDQGILHRDLKPANVMIDGRGQVKITDFGLSGLADEIRGDDVRAGTPGYMAPEQRSGQEVSVRSDVYSLGLVLHELFTGEPVFSGRTPAELERAQAESAPPSMTTRVENIDPAVERVVQRCLERDPGQRPSSALAVAAALPGGDPLAAALAAGETPSPEMVAGASVEGGLRRPVAVASLVVGLAGLLLVAAGMPVRGLLGYVPTDVDPKDLSVRARSIVTELGPAELPRVVRDGLVPDSGYLEWIEKNDPSAERWESLRSGRPAGMSYWLRTAPGSLEPAALHAFYVSVDDPPVDPPGGWTVMLDTRGRLTRLTTRPPERPFGEPPRVTGEAAIDRLFELAELDRSAFTPAEPVKPPPVSGDELRAWRDPSAEPETVVQVGMLEGRVTSFEILYPWQLVAEGGEGRDGTDAVELVFGLLFVAIVVAAIFLARRNIRAGRGDRRGAFRLVLFFVVTIVGSWLFLGVRLRDLDLFDLFDEVVFGRVLGHALVHAIFTWLMYLALEPYVRRLWPETLISWTRLLMGKLRDPLVGRDLLVGVAAGFLLMALGLWVEPLVRSWAGLPPGMPPTGSDWPVPTVATAMGEVLILAESAVYIPMIMLLLLLLCRLIGRRNWAGALLFVAVLSSLSLLGSDETLAAGRLIAFVSGAVLWITFVVLLLRFGLLSGIGLFVGTSMSMFAMTLDPSDWYAPHAFTLIVLLAGVLVSAFLTSLGRRPVFGGGMLAERGRASG